jgi:small subunit ribosomal protein S17
MPRKKKEETDNKVEVAPEAEAPVEATAEASATAGGPLPEYLRSRRTEVGNVVSDKMTNTVVVLVDRAKPHPLYKKIMRRSARFMAHDEMGAAIGDRVRIIESRPISKNKRWRVVEILQRAETV